MIAANVASIFGAALICAVALYVWLRVRSGPNKARIQAHARDLLQQAKRTSAAILEARLKAEASGIKARADHERHVQEEKLELQAIEKRLLARESTIDFRITTLKARSAELTGRGQAFLARRQQLVLEEVDIGRLTAQARYPVERLAGLAREGAKLTLVDEVEAEARHEAVHRVRQVEERSREEADRKAKKIITMAIERLAGGFIAERTVSVVHLPSDDMKGRIIGREWRNIRAIEAATGVDLIVDDTPEAVIVSCHSPIRRKIARMALERLISDGRIHPRRIENLVRRAEQEVEDGVREAGRRAIFEVGVHG